MRNSKGQFIKGHKIGSWLLGYWKGKKRPPFSDATIEKMRIATQKRIDAGWKPSNGFKKGDKLQLGRHWKIKDTSKMGHKHTEETRKRMSKAHKGEKCYLWKGGITPMNEIIRHSLEYKFWRESVFAKDNYTCVICGDNMGGNLNAHHIKPFAYYPELRLAIDNGITLCIYCHKKTDNFGGKGLKRKIKNCNIHGSN